MESEDQPKTATQAGSGAQFMEPASRASGRGDDGAPSVAGSFAGCSLPKNHLLTDEGWEWRGNADERRAREMTDTYEELGFEVKQEPLDLNQLQESCLGCKDVMHSFSAVYVRKKS